MKIYENEIIRCGSGVYLTRLDHKIWWDRCWAAAEAVKVSDPDHRVEPVGVTVWEVKGKREDIFIVDVIEAGLPDKVVDTKLVLEVEGNFLEIEIIHLPS